LLLVSSDSVHTRATPDARGASARSLEDLLSFAQGIVAEHVLPRAQEVDREARWPQEGIRALMEAGLAGLHVPAHLGGHGQGLYALARMTETIALAFPSTAMCFGMHCVATAVIAAKATPDHEERYLRPIAEGRHLATLALSERGTGANFFLPAMRLAREGDSYRVQGEKQFVTNAAHADSYVISTEASDAAAEGEFSCLVLDAAAPGIAWGDAWRGLGMRGNDSRSMRIDARVPAANLLGREGEQVWYVFEVVAPYFLVAMAGVYLGVAQAALAIAARHVDARRHAHSGESVAQLPTVQHRVGELWIAVERCRALLHQAANQGDAGDPGAVLPLLASKVDAAEAAVHVTNEAMTLCGGSAFRENGALARLMRDARAGPVMAPTTDMLKLWIGRLTLGMPLL
jgi:alkylation response protein AidB-like acyl-CoA dehydrogenase